MLDYRKVQRKDATELRYLTVNSIHLSIARPVGLETNWHDP